MKPTAPQRRLLKEGEFDSPKLIQYKIQTSINNAKEMEGWDIIHTTKEQNEFYGLGATSTVASRFWTIEQAKKWAHKSDGDNIAINKLHDERFNMPCFIALVEYHYPDYEEE